MSKYVNAADAAEKIAEKHGIPIADLCDTLGDIPAADVVEVVHGRWEYIPQTLNTLSQLRCPFCGWWSLDPSIDGAYNYCPNCGAKMDKEEADDKKQPEEAPGE